MQTFARAAILAAMLVTALPATAAAQVIPPEPPPCPIPCPFPEGPVVVEDYRVEVTIEDQVATTRVI